MREEGGVGQRKIKGGRTRRWEEIKGDRWGRGEKREEGMVGGKRE